MMPSLFPPELPPGFRYEDAFLTADEEAALIAQIGAVTFSAFEMRGVVARRRVAFFGQAYDATRPAAPMPDFLQPLRQRAARWAGIDADALAMALINEYPPGAPIGWHRDAPQYDIVDRRVAAVAVPDAAAALRGAGRPCRQRRPPHQHARARAGTALDLPDLGTGAERLRAQHSAGGRAALLDHVPIAAQAARRRRR